VKLGVLALVLPTITSTGVLTVKLTPGTTLRVMPAAMAPYAETLPNARVAALVPAPDDNATPDASELNTMPMVEFTVAVTVSVPEALSPACATAIDDIIKAAMVKIIDFFMVGSSPDFFLLGISYFSKT
jgi:hypothetical protein